MVGVHGSVIQVLADGLGSMVQGVHMNLRPTALSAYNCVTIWSEGTRSPEYSESDGTGNWKLKDYRLRIEVFGRTLEDAELIGERVEAILESEATLAAIASLTETDPDGVTILDDGGEKYQAEREWPTTNGEPTVTHKGELHYSVTIRRRV